MGIIESNDYRETRAKLKKDPHIQQMAKEILHDDHRSPPLFHPSNAGSLSHGPPDYTPTHWFMDAALKEYKNRHLHAAPDPTESIPTHIGGPAEAIIELIREEEQ